MQKTGDNYPNGPCELPLICFKRGTVITNENVIEKDCDDECEVCEYCGNGKCHKCGTHWHCGGCI